MNLADFSTEVLVCIVQMLPTNDKKHLSLVSTRMNEIVSFVDGYWLKLSPNKVRRNYKQSNKLISFVILISSVITMR